MGHISPNCTMLRKESKGNGNPKADTKMVRSDQTCLTADVLDDQLQYLLSDSDDSGDVKQVRVKDEGSQPRRARVIVGGVPMMGTIDTAADATITGGDMFKMVVAFAKLRKRDLKPPDKSPYNYNRTPFKLHGKLVLDVTFLDRTIETSVYVKMDAMEPLLLSEGVCRQLGIVTYLPEVGAPEETAPNEPKIQVRLVQSMKLPPRPDESIVADVSWEQKGLKGPLLLEADASLRCTRDIHVADVFVSDADAEKGTARVVLTNCLGFTQKLECGEEIGRLLPVDVVRTQREDQAVVSKVTVDELSGEIPKGDEEERRNSEATRDAESRSGRPRAASCPSGGVSRCLQSRQGR